MANMMECTPREAHFCTLRAEGHTLTDAYRIAFNKPNMGVKAANQSASRLAKRPRVLLTLKELYLDAKKNLMLSHGHWLSGVLDDLEAARAAENWTAVASLQRLAGQGIGSLQDNINLNDNRYTDAQLLDRLAGQDRELAEFLRNRLAGRQDFDA